MTEILSDEQMQRAIIEIVESAPEGGIAEDDLKAGIDALETLAVRAATYAAWQTGHRLEREDASTDLAAQGWGWGWVVRRPTRPPPGMTPPVFPAR